MAQQYIFSYKKTKTKKSSKMQQLTIQQYNTGVKEMELSLLTASFELCN